MCAHSIYNKHMCRPEAAYWYRIIQFVARKNVIRHHVEADRASNSFLLHRSFVRH